MATLVIVVDSAQLSINEFNSRCIDANPQNEMNKLSNFLVGLAGGHMGGFVQVTSRDTDPGVTTSGTDSQQVTMTF